MRRITAVLIAGITAAVITACSGSDDGPTATSALGARTADSGEVNVEITPLRLDSNGATFLVALDTHSVELSVDLAASSTLNVGGTDWPADGWDGAPPGGHHREGELRFTAGGPATGVVTLTIAGLPEPVEVNWDIGA